MYSGIAIRMATDLNLHRKSVATFTHSPHPEDPAVLDREREILTVNARVCLFRRRPRSQPPDGQAIHHSRRLDHSQLPQLGKSFQSSLGPFPQCRGGSQPHQLKADGLPLLFHFLRLGSQHRDRLLARAAGLQRAAAGVARRMALARSFPDAEEAEAYFDKKRQKVAIDAGKAASNDKGKPQGSTGNGSGSGSGGESVGKDAKGSTQAEGYQFEDDEEDAENLDLTTRLIIHQST